MPKAGVRWAHLPPATSPANGPRTPVNSLVITAIANARQITLTYRNATVETGRDPGGHLRNFARACARTGRTD